MKEPRTKVFIWLSLHTFYNHNYDIIVFAFSFTLNLALVHPVYPPRDQRFHKVENNELAFLRVRVKMKTAERKEKKREARKKKPEIPFRDYAKCRSSRAAKKKK